jgi:hypothetical protein
MAAAERRRPAGPVAVCASSVTRTRRWSGIRLKMEKVVRQLRKKIDGVSELFTLDACRHGGMTELEEAELTDGQGRALSGHKAAQARLRRGNDEAGTLPRGTPITWCVAKRYRKMSIAQIWRLPARKLSTSISRFDVGQIERRAVTRNSTSWVPSSIQ